MAYFENDLQNPYINFEKEMTIVQKLFDLEGQLSVYSAKSSLN